MEKTIIMMCVIDFILVIISIINLIRINTYLDTENQNLEELLKVEEARTKLIIENYKYEKIFDAIKKILFERKQESVEEKYNKIKEVIKSAKQNNF